MILLVLLFLLVVYQLLSCHCKKTKRRREYYISSLSPVPPLSPSQITFLSNDELNMLLVNNSDRFFDHLFDYDLYARQIKNKDQYFENIKNSVDNFTDQDKIKIRNCTQECDKFLQRVTFPGFDGVKASNINWKLGKVKGKLYEYGLAHTRFNDLIILSDENLADEPAILTRTLIHEKVHLYQKQYPNDIEIYLEQHNFKKIKKREYDDYIRANPDLDDWIYKDNITGLVYKCTYNSKYPKNILDVNIRNQSFEHPFEKMAVEISYKK